MQMSAANYQLPYCGRRFWWNQLRVRMYVGGGIHFTCMPCPLIIANKSALKPAWIIYMRIKKKEIIIKNKTKLFTLRVCNTK